MFSQNVQFLFQGEFMSVFFHFGPYIETALSHISAFFPSPSSE
jgi:hypothetical protein